MDRMYLPDLGEVWECQEVGDLPTSPGSRLLCRLPPEDGSQDEEFWLFDESTQALGEMIARLPELTAENAHLRQALAGLLEVVEYNGAQFAEDLEAVDAARQALTPEEAK